MAKFGTLLTPAVVISLVLACQVAPRAPEPSTEGPAEAAPSGSAPETGPVAAPEPSAAGPAASATAIPAPTPVATPGPTAAPTAAPTAVPAGPTRAALGTAYRAESPEYGLSGFLMGHAETTPRDLKRITDLQFGWVKLLFPWRQIEGAGKGRFDWAEADRVVRAVRAAGLRIIARLDFQRGWARRDGAHNGPPDDYRDYADYVGAFMTRYKQGSGIGTVDAVEVWNEPNLDREWGGAAIGPAGAADYVRLLQGAYRAAKQADPGVTVISAGLSPTGIEDGSAQPDDAYLRWMYQAGAKPYFDVLAAQANVQCPCVEAAPGTVEAFKHPSFYFRRVEQLREIMVANGDADKQVWLMEFGWTTDRVHPAYAWYATTEQQKADLILQAFQFAREQWAPWIGVMTLWTIADPAWGPQDEQVWWSVTNPDGSTRPAYDRLLRAVAARELPPAGRVPAEAGPASSGAGQLRVVGTGGEGVSLRAAPSVGAVRVTAVREGALLMATGEARQSEGRSWRKVRDAGGAEGWVVAEFVAPA